MSSPDFNIRSKPHEHPREPREILAAFQDMRTVDVRYAKLGEAPTSPAYMRSLSLAVTGAKILNLMDQLEDTLYNNFDRTAQTRENSVTLMEDSINDPAYRNLTEMAPSSSNTVQALSALHMAEIYAAMTEYHLTNIGLGETERMGIGAPDDLNAFREMALQYLRQAANGLARNKGQWEAKDLQILGDDVQSQIDKAGTPHEAVHPVDKLIAYFSNIQGEHTPESLRFIHILDQRKAAIFARPDETDPAFKATSLET